MLGGQEELKEVDEGWRNPIREKQRNESSDHGRTGQGTDGNSSCSERFCGRSYHVGASSFAPLYRKAIANSSSRHSTSIKPFVFSNLQANLLDKEADARDQDCDKLSRTLDHRSSLHQENPGVS